jgi:5-methyltetrahydrofolate--homocysteine methyltransferase
MMTFDEVDWQALQEAWSTWWAGKLDRPLVILGGYKPGARIPSLPLYTAHLPPTLSDDEILDIYETELKVRCWYADTPPRWKMTYGAGIVAAFLGAKVNISPETVWFEPRHVSPIALMTIKPATEDDWWQKVCSLTRRAAERWAGKVCVSYVDLGGILDILASLRSTQSLLYELFDEPDQVIRLTQQITQRWLEYFNRLDNILAGSPCGVSTWAPLWAARRMYIFQCDFSYMISPAMFERFVLPDLLTCIEQVDHSFYHMDGKGQLPHLDMLMSIQKLSGVQWIPGEGQPPAENWITVLSRIRAAGKLCQVFVTAKGAQKLIRTLGGRGFALAITDEMAPDEAASFLDALKEDQKQAIRLS